MTKSLPKEGEASREQQLAAHLTWQAAARAGGVNVSGFDPAAPLADRVAWALACGLTIGTVLSRFSTKLQHSTESQIDDCVRFAAANRIYVPPEFLCVDEGVSGRKMRRAGLERVKQILAERLATVLVVFKISRLFRAAYKGYQFIQEEVVEEGLRAISISQGIDTADERTWKSMACLHGLMDDMLLTTIADHVRSGIKSLFSQGYVTGALTVGYRPVPVVGARPTNRGMPRATIEVDPDAEALIRQHYEYVLNGMPLRRAWRLWVESNGPCDPRSTLRHMSYNAYRRMLSNPRYTGRWMFGRRRNEWSTKRDYTRQVLQPDTEVLMRQCDELRIIDDELFDAVQDRLQKLKQSPRSPKKRDGVKLWDLVTGCFCCAECDAPFHQSGAGGRAMRCKRADLCPQMTNVRREQAVRAICTHLSSLLRNDASLVEDVVRAAQQRDLAGQGGIQETCRSLEQRIDSLSKKHDDLVELAGQGSDEDRAGLKARIRAVQSERAAVRAELARIRGSASRTEPVSADQIRELLGNLGTLLEDGAAGRLGADMIYRAGEIFRLLTGGRIRVRRVPRPGRNGTCVRGTFRPGLIQTIATELGTSCPSEAADVPEETVWLRPPPRVELLAERAHELIDVMGLSTRQTARALCDEGYNVNCGNVWYMYRRYFEMRQLPVPKLPYNNGHPPRKPGSGAA